MLDVSQRIDRTKAPKALLRHVAWSGDFCDLIVGISVRRAGMVKYEMNEDRLSYILREQITAGQQTRQISPWAATE